MHSWEKTEMGIAVSIVNLWFTIFSLKESTGDTVLISNSKMRKKNIMHV